MDKMLVTTTIMSLYFEVAKEHGLVVVNDGYPDEYEVSSPSDVDYSQTVSGEILLSEYCYYNNNNKQSYNTHDVKVLFSKLDELYTSDASSVGLSPHRYLRSLDELQGIFISMMPLEMDEDFDPIEWIVDQSEKTIKSMSITVTQI